MSSIQLLLRTLLNWQHLSKPTASGPTRTTLSLVTNQKPVRAAGTLDRNRKS